MASAWRKPEPDKPTDLVDEILSYEESVRDFSGPTTKRIAVVTKRVATLKNFTLLVTDEEGYSFSIYCPYWMYQKARVDMHVELVYKLVKTDDPDEYRERIIGINRLSPTGSRVISWVI